MHIAEGVLPISHCIAWFGVSAPFLAASGHHAAAARADASRTRRGLLGMASALIMAVSVLPIPVPGLGVTSHMCATPVLALLLGARALTIPTALVLIVQALFLAHGGVTTLGANICTLGVVGPFAAVALAQALRAVRVPRLVAVGLACGLADVLVYVVDAAIIALGLRGDQSFGHWFGTIALAFAPAQLPLAVLEGILSAGLVKALAARRADIAPPWLRLDTRRILERAPAAIIAFVLVVGAATARADEWKGLDDIVREKAKTTTADSRSLSLVEEGGELFTFCVAVTFLTAGFFLGRGWARLGHAESESHALRS
jgi:cobalt/nickel transport system permease protein